MKIISNLWEGRAGLLKTYWLWGVLSGIPWGLTLSLVTPGSNLGIFAMLAVLAYYLVVHVGVWRAASQYQGAKVWAILAKVAVAITPASLVVGMLAAIIIPATHQQSKQSQQATSTTQLATKENKEIAEPVNSNSQNISEDQKLLRKQGIGGNQDILDVKSWGNEQLSARSFSGDNLIKAHSFAAMWQRQIIQKLRISPERSLFLGYSIVLNNIDKDNRLCRPDMTKNEGVEDDEGGNLKTYPECFRK